MQTMFQRFEAWKKNARRGVATAGIARKWEGERRVRPPLTTRQDDQQDTLPDRNDLRFGAGGGKWNSRRGRLRGMELDLRETWPPE
jgi:hypothetical protein